MSSTTLHDTKIHHRSGWRAWMSRIGQYSTILTQEEEEAAASAVLQSSDVSATVVHSVRTFL